MIEQELAKIESAIGSPLPSKYRSFLKKSSEELQGIKEILTLRAILWTKAEEIIRENKNVRKFAKDMTIGDEERPWPRDYVVVGTNGGGDYWFIHLDGSKPGLWFYEHETGEISQVNKSFVSYLKELRRDAKSPERWQPPPIRSSFAPSCPMLERFRIFISRSACEIECQEGDRPLTQEKLRQHGVDIKKLGRCMLNVVAALSKCKPSSLRILSIEADLDPSSSGMLTINFSEPTLRDSQFNHVGVNMFGGNINVSLYGPKDKSPPPKKAGVDWSGFRKAVAELMQTLHPPGTGVKVSQPQPSRFTLLRQQWNYDLKYELA